jgi:hypothetical protein
MNFWHLIRPDLLNNVLIRGQPDSPAHDVLTFLTDDLLLILTLPFFGAFVAGGRASPTRRLMLTWTAYYLFMIVVLFHNESRYRSALVPFFFAGGAGGIAALVSGPPRRFLAGAGFAVGAALAVITTWPYVPMAWGAVASARALAPARAAIAAGDLAGASRIAEAAAALDSSGSRPWLRYGHWLASQDRPAEAVEAYLRADESMPASYRWRSVVALPRLLLDAGRSEEAADALSTADAFSRDIDPWLMLETAWRELPPPRTDEILLARGDYGAVRGFFHPRGSDPPPESSSPEGSDQRALASPQRPHAPPGRHRWSRGHAWLRLRPTREADSYLVTLTMGSPFPSPQAHPGVEVRVNDGRPTQFTLDAELRDYTVTAHVLRGAPIIVRLVAPTWSRVGQPADEGVRVDAMRVSPAPPDAR